MSYSFPAIRKLHALKPVSYSGRLLRRGLQHANI